MEPTRRGLCDRLTEARGSFATLGRASKNGRKHRGSLHKVELVMQNDRLKRENQRLKSENQRLKSENERLKGELEYLKTYRLLLKG